MVIKSLQVMGMSAKDLHNVNLMHRMDPYVIVSLSGNHKKQTDVHKNGGTSPRWFNSLAFPIDETCDDLILVFEIMTEKTHDGDKEVGRVEVTIAELLENRGDGNPMTMSCNVSLPSRVGKTRGVLEFKYKFREELPGGCGNTPAPGRGRTQKSRGLAGAVAGRLGVEVAGGVAGELIGGAVLSEAAEDEEDEEDEEDDVLDI